MTDERRVLARKLRDEPGIRLAGIMDVVNALRATNWSEDAARQYLKDNASLRFLR